MKKTKLGEVLDVKRGTSLAGKYYSNTGKYIRLTLGNFNYPNGGFKENTSKSDIYFTGPVNDEFILKKGDIITPLTEQVAGLLGETARIPESDKYIQSGDIGLIKTFENLDDSYAYYLISSPIVKKQLGAGAQQTKIRHTSPEKIKDCDVWLPDIIQQRRAGKLLDEINTLINNNFKIIENISEIVNSIYSKWFLQYDFPNEENKSYCSSKGEMAWNEYYKKLIPKNWTEKSIREIENEIITGKTPSTKISGNFGGNIPFITIDDIRQSSFIYETNRTLTKTGADSQSKKYIPENSICVTCIATVGLVGITTQLSQTNQQINSIVCKDKNNLYYLFNAIKDYFKYSSGAKSGNIFDNMNKDDFSMIKLIYPDNNTLSKYHDLVEPLYENIKNCSKQIIELKKIRNMLLPLFINGQIKIED